MRVYLNKFLFILIVLVFYNFTCGSSEVRKGNPLFAKNVKYFQVGKGDSEWKPSDKMFGPQLVIFRSDKLWQEKKHLFNLNPSSTDSAAEEMLDKINFEKESVLIFTFGLVGSTGYSLDVKNLTVNKILECRLISKRPLPNETTGAVMQHPFVLTVVESPSIPDKYKIYIDNKLTDFKVHRFE